MHDGRGMKVGRTVWRGIGGLVLLSGMSCATGQSLEHGSPPGAAAVTRGTRDGATVQPGITTQWPTPRHMAKPLY